MNKRILLEIYVPSLDRLVEIRCSESATVEYVEKTLARYLFGGSPESMTDMMLCRCEGGDPLDPRLSMYGTGLHNGGGLILV